MDNKVNVKITSEGDVAVAVFEAVSISNTEGISAASEKVKALYPSHAYIVNTSESYEKYIEG